MAPGRLARVKAALMRGWEMVQVEHQGLYSLERAQQLLSYLRGRSVALQTALTLVLTPLPCVVALILMDIIPLQDPTLGADANIGFLVRSIIAVMGYTAFIVGQIHVCVPNLLRLRSLLWIAPVVSGITSGTNYLMSLWIGFPLPFTHVLGLAPWVSSLLLSLWVAIGREGRRNQAVRRALHEHGALIMAQSSLGVVYPLFYRLFLVSGPTAQFFVVLLLPAIKLAMKFRINQVTPHIQDLQPVTLTFNAEVFNSLFTSSCMQGSNSTATSVALMSVDFVYSTYSLYRLSGLVASVEQLGSQFGVSREQMLPAVALLAQRVPDNVWEAHGVAVQTHCSSSATVVQSIGSGSSGKSAVAPTPTPKLFARRSRVSPHDQRSDRRPRRFVWLSHSVVPALLSNKRSKRVANPPASASVPSTALISTAAAAKELRADSELATEDQVRCVRQVLTVYRRTEYLVLIEYTEVIVPMVYGTYLTLSYNLPARPYYPLLKDLDESSMRRVVLNIYLYGALQLLSFVLLNAVLLRRLRIAAHHQVAFVLRQHWRFVQCNLVLWMVYTIQSSLEHVGMDYSFRFEWLKHPS